jgi:hypothetical protein
MAKAVHPVAGVIAFLTIGTFWLATVLAELFGSHASVVALKSAIPWGFLLLLPAVAAAGGTGFALSKGRGAGVLLVAKKKRMAIVAANGLLVLIPAAFFLAGKAKAGEFDGVFYAVQILELVAGATNLSLLGLNLKDGLRMKGRPRSRPASVGTKAA